MKLHYLLEDYYKQLKSEGYKVYTHKSYYSKLIESIVWYEKGRVLRLHVDLIVVQMTTSYVKDSKIGSGCFLSNFSFYSKEKLPDNILEAYRNEATWTNGYKNYSSIEEYIKKNKGLEYYEIKEEDV